MIKYLIIPYKRVSGISWNLNLAVYRRPSFLPTIFLLTLFSALGRGLNVDRINSRLELTNS